MGRRKKELTPEQARFHRKRKIVEGILKNYDRWYAYYHDEGLQSITIDGEEWHFLDVFDGIDSLPPRQKTALWLYCVENRKEVEVARMMGFERWSTPVQQYRNIALNKLVAIHEERSKEREIKHAV